MALSNAERQARHRFRQRARLAEALRNAAPLAAPKSTAKEIEALRKRLAAAEDKIAEKEAQRAAQESRANIAARQVDAATNRAMYAEADKARLAAELEALRNAPTTDAVEEILRLLQELGEEERAELWRRARPYLAEGYVPKHWFEDAALELHLARGTSLPAALAAKRISVT